jgi:hypothetical protein
MSGVSNIDFDQPDETQTVPHGQWDIVHIGDLRIRRGAFEPGWRWSTDVKPIVGTESCQQHHVGYVVSGRLGVAMEDGTETVCQTGQAYLIEPGHDGWTEGDEPLVVVEFATQV